MNAEFSKINKQTETKIFKEETNHMKTTKRTLCGLLSLALVLLLALTAAVPAFAADTENRTITIHNNEIGPISQMLYDEITGIQYGKREDPFGWSMVL